jgi:pimeloyl-ACP methyl ester carboxylesterase
MMSPARPRLLLVHGLPGSLSYFAPRRYLPGVDVSTPDLVGCGRHRSEETGITLAGQAAMLARFLRDAAGKVLGHGVGGAIAMLLADLAPDLVRGLISVEGTTR